MPKLRTNQDTFCKRNCGAMTTWTVNGWRKKKHLQPERVSRTFKQHLESHSNFGERATPGEKLDVLSIHSHGGGSFSNLNIEGNMSLISFPG